MLDDFYMFASDVSKIVTVGEMATVNVDGTDVELEVVGANTDNDEATIKVNGEMKQVGEGDSVKVAGVDLYIKNIFMQTIPTASAAVEFFVGSEKWRFHHGNELEIGGDSIDSVIVDIVNNSAGITSIWLNVTPKEGDLEYDNGDDMSYLPMGVPYIDPAFATFNMLYAGPERAAATQVTFERDGSKKMQLTFTTESNVENSIDIVNYYDTNVLNVSDGDDMIWTAAGSTLGKKEFCILSDAKSTVGYTHIIQLRNVDDDSHNLEIDVVGGTSKTVSYDETGLSGSIELDGLTATFTNVDEAAESIDLDCTNVMYTKGGMKIEIFTNQEWNGTGGPMWTGNATYVTFNLTEDFFENSEGNKANNYYVEVEADTSDEEIDISAVGYTWVSVDDIDEDYAATGYGCFVTYDAENDDYLNVEYREDVNTHAVFVAPLGALPAQSGGDGSVETVTIDRINVGTAVLASQSANLAAQNVVSVGGPGVNSVTATLLGLPYPSYGEASTIPENKALLKMVDNGDNVALLVMGWNAADTQRAARVIANSASYSLSGSEMVVSGTSFSDITVAAPSTV